MNTIAVLFALTLLSFGLTFYYVMPDCLFTKQRCPVILKDNGSTN